VGACHAGVRLGLGWLAWLADLEAWRADALSSTGSFQIAWRRQYRNLTFAPAAHRGAQGSSRPMSTQHARAVGEGQQEGAVAIRGAHRSVGASEQSTMGG